ncbi:MULTISPECIES: glycoside hydrolase family 32 protein [unclassified Microbacterium]|uniref:glycoside hydrolase family 32 protein n=1 Tax=unclassified Microbacterium TaxID=2609290 RepID=UPI00341FFCE2
MGTEERPLARVVPRPAFHFTPRTNWMNDPNGLVHVDGVWHLYFQYNPEGADWGNMSWGHATSGDLRRWTEHEVALSCRPGEQMFSGSAVVAPDGGLVAYYTSAYDDGRQAQSRARSVDGRYWVTDPPGPVLDRGTTAFRDPKIIRHIDDDGTLTWVMLAVEAEDRQVLFHTSRDLLTWEYRGSYGPLGPEGVVWECPDLVRLRVDGREDDQRWVLVVSTNPVGADADADGSSMSWVIGDFDGAVFVADDAELRRLDHGRDFYAGVTFDSAPDGDAIMVGWMSNWRYAADVPAAPSRGAMSLPRRLSLRTDDHGPALCQQPADFLRDILAGEPEHRVSTPWARAHEAHAVLELRWDPAQTGTLRYEVSGDADAVLAVEHRPESGDVRITRSGTDAAALHPDFPSSVEFTLTASSEARMLVVVDGPLVEIFFGEGEQTASHLLFTDSEAVASRITTAHDEVVAVRLGTVT